MLAILLLSARASADDSLTETLVAQEKKLIDAIGKNDSVTIAKMLADESYSITESRGRRSNEEVIQDLEQLRYASYKISDAFAVPLTGDVAILTYTFSYAVDATSPTVTVDATSIWKRNGAQWDTVFYQETPVKK